MKDDNKFPKRRRLKSREIKRPPLRVISQLQQQSEASGPRSIKQNKGQRISSHDILRGSVKSILP